MIGNDIIDKSLAKQSSNWQRRGWLQKTCTDKEVSMILDSQDSFFTAWRIWSMKESAYKIWVQAGASHRLNPIKFETTLVDDCIGRVSIDSKLFQTYTENDTEYISTIASDNIQDAKHRVISAKLNLKEKMIASFAMTNNVKRSEISIKTNANRIPMIYINESPINCSISMSHHGQYAAYAYPININKII